MADNRVRLWTTILYPQDIKRKYPDYVLNELISSLNVPAVMSPLHAPDPDNIAPEEQRKKHFHLMLAFEGKKSLHQVEMLMESILPDHVGWVRPMEVASAKGLVRYFLHLDQPEKQQFSGKWQAMTTFGGFKLDDYLEPSSSEKYLYIRQMKEYCRKHHIYEISDLMDIADELYPDTWGYVLSMCCTIPIKVYIDSRRHKVENERKDL